VIPPAAATLAAVSAVVAAIGRCPQAVAGRDRAAVIIRGAQEPEADLAGAERAALRECAAAAVAVLESDPSLAQLVTAAALGLYIFRQACVVAMGGDGWTVELDLRPPNLN
jgi:hypothetical protein